MATHSSTLAWRIPWTLMARGAWGATVHRVAKSQTQLKRVSMHASWKISNTQNRALLPLGKLLLPGIPRTPPPSPGAPPPSLTDGLHFAVSFMDSPCHHGPCFSFLLLL